MIKTAKFLVVLAFAAMTIGMTAGCTDQVARDMAQDALNKANAAQACCDRQYQKIMSK
jgi:hypothetical protein